MHLSSNVFLITIIAILLIISFINTIISGISVKALKTLDGYTVENGSHIVKLNYITIVFNIVSLLLSASLLYKVNSLNSKSTSYTSFSSPSIVQGVYPNTSQPAPAAAPSSSSLMHPSSPVQPPASKNLDSTVHNPAFTASSLYEQGFPYGKPPSSSFRSFKDSGVDSTLY